MRHGIHCKFYLYTYFRSWPRPSCRRSRRQCHRQTRTPRNVCCHIGTARSDSSLVALHTHNHPLTSGVMTSSKMPSPLNLGLSINCTKNLILVEGFLFKDAKIGAKNPRQKNLEAKLNFSLQVIFLVENLQLYRSENCSFLVRRLR